MSPHRHDNPAEHVDVGPSDGLFGCLLLGIISWLAVLAVGVLTVQAVRVIAGVL